MKSIKKIWLSSLSFLEHNVVYSIIVFVIVLYTLGIFDGINSFIGGLYNFFIVRLIVILLIIWVAPKDPTIAILLALSYAVSLQHMSTSERFVSPIAVEEEIKRYNMTVMDNVKENKEEQEEKINEVRKHHNKDKKEHFFPLMNESESPDLRMGVQTKEKNITNHNNTTNNSSCMDMYVPEFESISNVCDSVATFQGELNAQGLNFPEGFNSVSVGSPVV